MASKEVWGIDIGRSAIKAVKMRRIKNQVEIVAIEIIAYEQSSEAEVDQEEQIRQALLEFQSRVKLKKNEKIYVSIPGQATFNRMITIPPVEARRVKEIVTYEAQQQIPFPIDEVLWDYQLVKDAEKSLEEQEVMLFAVRKEIINNFLANLAAVEISVEGIQIAPLALYNFLRFDQPELSICVGVDLGAENTDLVIVHGSKLWVRALPSAGDDITKALQKKFNIPYQEAEKLKLKAGKTKQAKKIFEVIKPVLKDIVGEIHRSVGYYKSMVKDIKFDKMIFMGNATKLTGFQQFFSQNLQYNVEVLSQANQIRISPDINVNLFQTNITSFAVAMGLGIQGLGLAANNIRLLPKEIADKTAIEKQKPFLALAVGLLALVPMGMYVQQQSLLNRMSEKNEEMAPLVKEIKGYQEQLRKANTYGHIQKQITNLVTVGHNRTRYLEILEGINSIYLNLFKQAPPTPSRHKIWILGLDIRKKGEVAQIKFDVAFQSLGEPLKDYNYITKYLKDPLETVKDYKNNNLFEDITIRKPQGGPEEENLYNATILFYSKLTDPKKK